MDPKRTAIPLKRVDLNDKSSNKKGEHIGHIDNEGPRYSTKAKHCCNISRSLRQKRKCYTPSQKTPSGQFDNEKDNNELPLDRSTALKYKRSQNENQAMKIKRPDISSGTMQAEESRHKEVQIEKKSKRTSTLLNMCLGNTLQQITNEPHSIRGPEERQEWRGNKSDGVYEIKL